MESRLNPAKTMLRAWRQMAVVADGAQSSQIVMRNTKRCAARTTFEMWSKSVPACTRKWARLFTKLDFEMHRQTTPEASAKATGIPASADTGNTAGVARYFGASNAKELRKVFAEFMKDISMEEREELRFVLHAEAIRRGLGKYSITARRAMPVGKHSL
jgi:hypothetical protein